MVRNVHVSFDEVRHVLRQGLTLKKPLSAHKACLDLKFITYQVQCKAKLFFYTSDVS